MRDRAVPRKNAAAESIVGGHGGLPKDQVSLAEVFIGCGCLSDEVAAGVRLQEMETTDVGPGRMPRMIEVELYEDLVDTCIPGNVVTISGIVKSINSEIHEGRYGKRAQANSLYILYICANSVENSAKVDKDKDKASDIDFTKEDLEQISNIINQGDVFDRLVHSLCPGIYRNDIVKAGLILALLGGTRNTDDKDTTCVRRADSHVLVVGDPGLGKSQMLRAVSMVAPRAVYVGGNTTTTTGLTVTMVKDGSGDYALEAGALVLADQGVCCIDEFDKMGIDYQALLEAMEQQSISIAKAGIVCNLNARTSVIAAANPSGGHYDRSRSVGENLKMKAALLSRFDLVFILLDRPDEERDRLLSEHVMNSHARGRRKSRKRMRDTSAPMGSWSSRSYADEPPASGYEEAPTSDHQLLSHRLRHNAAEYSMSPIPLYFVRKFIAYARRYVHPRLSSEAAAVLQKKYLELRSAGEGQQNPTDSIPITTRQLESLIRLSQARARAELAETVSAEHAQDVVDIMQECLLDTLVTEDGNLDFGRSGGMSLAKKVKAYVARLMKAAARRNTSLFTMDDLLEVADSMGLKVDDFRDFVDILRNECYLLKKGPGHIKDKRGGGGHFIFPSPPQKARGLNKKQLALLDVELLAAGLGLLVHDVLRPLGREEVVAGLLLCRHFDKTLRMTHAVLEDDSGQRHHRGKREDEWNLEDVLRRNGEIHLCENILKLVVHADDDPPVIFGWQFVQEFVEAIAAAYSDYEADGATVPTPPFAIPDPLTRESFKKALLDYARVGTADPFGTTCLPCTASDSEVADPT
ncbi:hypothetical protein ON010_g8989 [Phytophthora cinnamomi]|nr:hypothetical protein ON010_g8989 [Phytophthora cinnamomi]